MSSPPTNVSSKKSSPASASQLPCPNNRDESTTDHPATPPSPYSPKPASHSHTEELISTSHYMEVRQEVHQTEGRSVTEEVADKYGSGRERSGEESSVNYDPMKFSYERMSSPLQETETSPQSPPSPTSQDSNPDEGERFNYDNTIKHPGEKRPEVKSSSRHSRPSSGSSTTSDSTR